MNACFRGLQCLSMDTKLDFKGQKLRIASLKSLPFQNVRKIDEYHYIGEGFSFEIVKQLSRHFNFTYDVVVPYDQDFGVLINGSRWTGLIGMLLNDEADMVAAPLSITQERQNAVTFSSSLYKDSLGLMFTRPETQHNNEALLAPFTNTVWVSVVVVALALCPVLYALMYASKCLLSKDVGTLFIKDNWTLSECAWFVYSSLMKQGFGRTSVFNPVRILMAAWWMTCLLLTAFYTANLTAFMTTETSVTDRTIEELIRSGRKWMFRKGTAFSDYLFKESKAEHEKDFSLLKKSFIHGNGLMIDSDDEVIDFLRKGYAYIQEVNVLNYMLFEDSMETNGSCMFNAIDLHFFEHTTAFAFSQGSHYAIPFSQYIEFLRKIGLVQKWMQQYLLSADVCAFHFDNKLSRKEQALTIYEFHTAFYILCIGAVFGFLCLFIELRKTMHRLLIETRGRIFKTLIKILLRIIKSINSYNHPQKPVLTKRKNKFNK